MLVYVAIALVPLLLYFFPVKQKKLMLYSILVILFLVSTFRDVNIGTDYKRYVYYFHQIANGGKAFFEKGFIWLNTVASKLGNDYWILAGIINLMLFLPLTIYTKKVANETKYWIVVLLVFVLNPYMYIQTTFNILRQCCASGIILLSEKYLRKKKHVIFFVLVLLASLFHEAAIFLLILPFAFSIKWTKKKWFVLSTVTFILSVTVAGPIIDLAMELVAEISRFGHYGDYEASLLNNPVYIVFVFVYVLILVSQYDSLVTDDKSKWYVNLYLFSKIMLFLTVKNDMFYRVGIMISFLSIGALPRIFEKIDELQNDKNNLFFVRYGQLFKVLHIAYYVCFYAGYILYLWIRGNTAYIPFKFCF